MPADGTLQVISIGKKSSEMLAHRKDIQLITHDELFDDPSFDNVAALADGIMKQFEDKMVDHVEIIYNQFKNSLTQILTTEQWLPVVPKDLKGSKDLKDSKANDYIYEPTKEDIVRSMVPLTLRSTFYRMVLDSLASEHGARMNAMQNATDNADELLKELRLSYNKARQASITNEIIEIVSGSEALKG
jgi:F-type H+-transporting ATPase subunit gamma